MTSISPLTDNVSPPAEKSVQDPSESAGPQITFLATKYIPSPESDNFVGRTDDALGLPLAEALTRQWPTDAHCTAYAPVTIEGVGPLRLASGALSEGVAVRMVALIGDVDGPDHKASDEWRAEVLPRIEASGLAHYSTAGGYRLLATLAEPIEMTDPSDAADWRALYNGWADELEAEHGLKIDRACADWTRCYRLPCVRRDGADVSASVVGELPAVDWHAITPAAVKATHADKPEPEGGDPETVEPLIQELADAIEEVWNEGTPSKPAHNGFRLPFLGWLAGKGWSRDERTALIETLAASLGATPALVARYLSDIGRVTPLPGPGDDVKEALGDSFSAVDRVVNKHPNSKPKVDPAMAARAEARAASRLARAAGATAPSVAGGAANDTAPADAPQDPFASLGRIVDLTQPPKPLNYICAFFGIAPSKISTFAGFAGTGKGPLLNLFAVCVAVGVPFLGHAVRRARVLIWDCETGDLLHQRLHRIANALGADLLALVREGWLTVVEGTPPLTDENLGTLRALATQRRIELLALDSYTSAFMGLKQNDAEFSGPAFLLGSLSNETGCAVLVTTHDRKSTSSGGAGSDFENQSGHNSLHAAQQASVRLVRPNKDDATLIELRCGRHPEEGYKPVRVRWENVDAPGAGKGLGSQLAASKWGLRAVLVETTGEAVANASNPEFAMAKRMLDRLARKTDGQASKTWLAERSGGNKAAALALVVKLADDGALEEFEFNDGNTVRYRLPPNSVAAAEGRAKWSKGSPAKRGAGGKA